MRKIFYLLFVVLTILSFLSCHKESDDVDVSKIIEIHDNAVNILNDLEGVPGQSIETILNNCVQQLLLNPEVASAQVLDSNQIIIRDKSGITSVVYLDEETEGQDKSSSKLTNVSINKGLNDEVLITNHKVLIWNAWGSASETTTLQNIFSNCSDIDFEVDVKQGNECTIQSLSDLTKYGFIYIGTHGNVLTNSHGEELTWLLTNEICSPSDYSVKEVKGERIVVITKVELTKEYIGNQEVISFPEGGKHYWGISNKYISQQVTGTFSGPSVVFVSACKSFTSSSLRNAFIDDKNASFYLGFNYKVSFGFSKKKAVEFITNMLQKRQNALEAYKAIEVTVDPIRRGVLICSRKEIPTYFGSKGYVESPTLNKRWTLHSSSFWGDVDTYSEFVMEGDSFYVQFNLTAMANMLEGTYTPFVINDYNESIIQNGFHIPMRFIVETSADDLWLACGSYFSVNDDYPDITGGQLVYEKQNNQKHYIFNFTDENGYTYHGEYTE